MKGLCKYAVGFEGVEIREIPEPIVGIRELKVKVLAAGICNSDVHAIMDERSVKMPVVLGHEYVGQIVQIGEDVKNFKVGDWVSTLPACYSCGECPMCKKGMVTLCSQRKSIGSHVDGAMTNYVNVPAKYSFKLPQTIKTLKDRLDYALAEPLACMVHGVYEMVEVNPDDVVVISGPGIMGLMAVQLFKARGARVILSGLPVDSKKLELALELGAEAIVTNSEDLIREVRVRNPLGADITCDTAGVVQSLESCMSVIRPQGKHLQIGLFGGKINFRLDSLFDREVCYVPSNSSTVTSWEITMNLLDQKKVTVKPFISMLCPLAKWHDALDAVLKKQVFKALLIPDNNFDGETLLRNEAIHCL